jgi:nucleotide sugar dehydrogenase
MNISILGVGKLGLCFGLNLERAGHKITGVDVREDYIEKLKSKEFKSSEPEVSDLLVRSNNITFSTSIDLALKNDIIFICVQTPSTEDHRYDHSRIESLVEQIIRRGRSKLRKEIIINCTTFPGYCESLQERLSEFNYRVSYNPEFIAQGSIIRDQINCDHVLIGESDLESGNLIEEIYKSLCKSSPIINRMTPTEAEITKLSINCFLTTKISFANMVGDISEKYGCNTKNILKAVGSDHRIGTKYLSYGFGFGGPCFPRDNRALSVFAKDVGIEAIISNATDEMNKKHLKYQIDNFVEKNKDKDKVVEIEYVTYKKESTIIEESQQLKFAIALKDMGYSIKILDQRDEVIDQIKDLL